jgi:hypothetical protein
MKRKLIHIFLLLSLFFNVAHASIIAIEDREHGCHHSDAIAYVMELSQGDQCGDLCDLHHLFHFVAIVTDDLLQIEMPNNTAVLQQLSVSYPSPLIRDMIKPPIV